MIVYNYYCTTFRFACRREDVIGYHEYIVHQWGGVCMLTYPEVALVLMRHNEIYAEMFK